MRPSHRAAPAAPLLLLLPLLVAGGRRASAAETMSAADARVTWVGRTQTDASGAAFFDWEGVYATVTVAAPFTFLTAAIADNCGGTGVGGGSRWAVLMTPADAGASAPAHRIATIWSAASVRDYVLFSSPGARCDPNCNLNGNVTFRLQRLTESRLSGCGPAGNLSVVSFTTDGSFLQAPAPGPKRLEFVGDSITAGDLNDGAPSTLCGNAVFNDDIIYSTGGQLCLHESQGGFGAECVYTAWGGIRLGLTGWGMNQLYFNTFSANGENAYGAYDFSFGVDAVVVNLGTNDGPVNPALPWQAAYVKFVRAVFAAYAASAPKLAVFVAYGPMTSNYEPEVLNITKTLAAAGRNVHALDLTLPHPMTGCFGHPSLADNVEIAAKAKPQIAAVLGW